MPASRTAKRGRGGQGPVALAGFYAIGAAKATTRDCGAQFLVRVFRHGPACAQLLQSVFGV
jgi:hypothetical protein